MLIEAHTDASARENAPTKPPRVMRTRFNHLQVVLKTAERCNLACSYCYYFFGGDESYRERPAVINEKTIRSIARYLVDGCLELGIPNLLLAFHGGEPMMQKPRNFARMCEIFEEAAGGRIRIEFSMQTNGTLIDDRWLPLLHRHAVSVGVSVDGTKEVHDRYRIDHFGRGSYDRVAKGLAAIRGSNTSESSLNVGSISVLGPKQDYRETYRTLRKELQLDSMSFLLPDTSHDQGIPDGATALDYGRALCDIFDEWVAEDQASVTVRQVRDFLTHFQQRKEPPVISAPMPESFGDGKSVNEFQIIVIHSDGKVAVNDSYIPALDWQQKAPQMHVDEQSLGEFLNHDVFDELDRAMQTLPDGCRDCRWKRVCRGGDLENRYSRARGFDNPSVYCEGLKLFYSHVERYLVESGYPRELFDRKLANAGAALRE